MSSKNLILLIIAFGSLAASYYFFKFRKKQEATIERTFAIIKPEAVAAGKAPEIVKIITDNGFTILAQKELTLDKDAAEKFYAVHKERPFFADLVTYITSGPVIVLAIEKADAVKAWRTLMGATNPEKAEPGTIRKLFGTDIQRNAVHGSDSPENAKKEIAQFFPNL